MALTSGDKAECKEIAREIVREVLAAHIKGCPHHQAWLVSKAKVIGIAIGVVVASGATSGTIATLIMKFF